jgi:hypothetical protein
MDIEIFYSELQDLERIIRDKGLKPTVHGFFFWIGDEIAIQVTAAETYDEKGYWHSERHFGGKLGDVADLLRNAFEFVHALPGAEDRAIELMVQKLNKLASELPKGSTDIAAAAWKEVHTMLVSKAERIAKNGLPSPQRISVLQA